MDVHRGFTGVTEDQLHAAHQRDLTSRPPKACTSSGLA
jgi:hypothetical protein